MAEIAKAKKQKNENAKEPELVVKKLGRFGYLDTIHISLIVLAAILVALLLVVSYSKPVVLIRNVTNSTQPLNCTYGLQNGKCVVPLHNVSEVEAQAERVLASYAYLNSSLSLLAYFSDIKNASYAYLPSEGSWLATIPATNPATGTRFMFYLLINGTTLNATPYLQTIMPSKIIPNRVVSQGVIAVNGKFACQSQYPLQVFWFIDPYAPGSIASLLNATSIQSRFGGKVNVSVKVLYGAYSSLIGSRFGQLNAEALSKYVLCASTQSNFSRFATNLYAAYSGSYMPNQTLMTIARESSLNITDLDSCIANSTTIMNRQALLAEYYNITSTPVDIVNCEYMTLPQTAVNGICYANSTLC
ncbi:MAG: hypothetical protein QW346_02825 [Candidatus Micrarchaeaceae archaeon]